MIGTAALQLPRRPDRLRLQVGLLERRAVARVVAEHGGRLDYLAAVCEVAIRHGGSSGAAFAAVRRAVLAQHVVVDGTDLVLPVEAAAARRQISHLMITGFWGFAG